MRRSLFALFLFSPEPALVAGHDGPTVKAPPSREIAPADTRSIAELIEALADDDFRTREKASKALTAHVPKELEALRKARAATSNAERRQRLQALIGAYDSWPFESWDQVVAALTHALSESPELIAELGYLDRVLRAIDPPTLAILRSYRREFDAIEFERKAKDQDIALSVALLEKQIALQKKAGETVRKALERSKLKVSVDNSGEDSVVTIEGRSFTLFDVMRTPAVTGGPAGQFTVKLGTALRAKYGKVRDGFLLPDGTKIDEKKLDEAKFEIKLLGDSYEPTYGVTWKFVAKDNVHHETPNIYAPVIAHLQSIYPKATIPDGKFARLPGYRPKATHPTAGKASKDTGPGN